ncbi:hypothetical protein HK101_004673 [Irineochytrium annulatum]|nr:hypothetical protein HK101_004673 [Irineochytrium annulatum]
MSAGSAAYTVYLSLISFAEILSSDPDAHVHVTRGALAPILYLELLSIAASYRALYLATHEPAETTPRAATGLLLGVWAVGGPVLALMTMGGLAVAKENIAASRALLAFCAMVWAAPMQMAAVRAVTKTGSATAAVAAATDANQAGETRPLLNAAPANGTVSSRFTSGVLLSTVLQLLLWSLLATNAVFRAHDAVVYPPPGKVVWIRNNAHAVHIFCEGDGFPTVVMDTGMSVPASLSWKYIQGPIRERPSYGYSDSGPLPQTSLKIADALKETLEAAGEKGPFVLVGHSFGGFNIRVFSHRFQEQAAGLVFLDASHEDLYSTADAIDRVNTPGTIQRQADHDNVYDAYALGLVGPFAVDRMFAMDMLEMLWETKLSPRDVSNVFNNRYPKGVASEIVHFVNASAGMARRTTPPKPWKDFPVAVVTPDKLIADACPPSEYDLDTCNGTRALNTAHRDTQHRLLKEIGDVSRQFMARDSGHFVMFDDAEVSVEAVLWCVREVRERHRGAVFLGFGEAAGEEKQLDNEDVEEREDL